METTKNGHKPKSSTSLAEDWKRLGFENIHERSGSVWHGVELKPIGLIV